MGGKSREGTKAAEKNLLAVRKFRDFLEVFFRYQEMLEKTQRYDYEDMILTPIRALEEEDWLLASLQERYLYLLVDEFQDTNGAQMELIELLTKARTPEDKPNLFVVGDDDQAIYRFQGANLANILKFRDRFPASPVIPLTVSYRCSQPILDAAGRLIAVNTERLVGQVDGLKKNLLSSRKGEDAPLPRLLFAPSDAVEPWLIADLVEERLARTARPEEIAILCQTNAEVLETAETLTARGIPVSVTGKADLLHHPLVLQALAILKAVEHPRAESALAAALACRCFGLHPADIGRLQLEAREKDRNLHDLLLALDDPSVLPALADRAAVLNARNILLDLHQKLQVRSVVETLEHVIKGSGLLAYAKGEARGSPGFNPLDFAALQEFFDRLRKRAYETPGFSFEQFLAELQYYENPDYADLRLSYSLPHLTEHGVAVMTAHQSKGLEFDCVILPNFREGHWDSRRHPPSVSIPEDLLFGWQKDQRSFEKSQDERRLAYVAMTRARRELLFICPRELTTGEKTRSVSPSRFLAEAGNLPEETAELRDPGRAALLLHEPVPDFDAEMKAFLKSRLENYALSVTALNHFLEDPKLFLEIDLLETPQAKEPSLIYGNAVHDALRKWGLSVQQGNPLTEAQFLAAFRTYLKEREILTEAERARLLKIGEEALPRYYHARLSGPPPLVSKVEYVVATHSGEIPIKGKIDRIDLLHPESSDAIVIDYKTGRPMTPKEIRDKGDYYRQLLFYALLLGEKGALLTPREFILDFIGEGSEHPVTRSFTIAESEIAELKKIVQAVWAKITALDFTPLP
jgi:DNA helicase-2/ATP-dependent DNA helicase PcrA